MPKSFYASLALVALAVVVTLARPVRSGVQPKAVTLVDVRDILSHAAPGDLAVLNELMFIADLQMARGNEDNPLQVFHSIEQRLSAPVVVSEDAVAAVLDHMRGTMRATPPHTVLSQPRGYDLVETLLAPVGGAFPATEACLALILANPDADLVTAFLTRAYFSGDFYHAHNMRHKILEALVYGGLGDRPLVVIEEALRNAYATPSVDTDFGLAVRAGREIMGPDFDAWYVSIRGKPYAWETVRLF